MTQKKQIQILFRKLYLKKIREKGNRKSDENKRVSMP